jgi:hypothetical protein
VGFYVVGVEFLEPDDDDDDDDDDVDGNFI